MAALTAWVAGAGISAAVPGVLTHQGRLLTAAGEPLNTNVSVAVEMHAHPTASAAVYAEFVGDVTVWNGLYSFEFGTNAAAMAAVLERESVWLEVQIDGVPLSPRQELLSVPYAVRSGEADVEYDSVWSAVSNRVTEGALQGAEAYSWGDHRTNGYMTSGVDYDSRYVNSTGDVMTGTLILPAGGLSVGSSQFVITPSGNIGVGVANPTNTLAVNGDVRAREVVVTVDGWPDYVFEPEYKLRALEDVEAFIAQHGHLPELPRAAAAEAEGVSLGRMQVRMLEKIEELTLYILQLRRENEALRQRLDAVEKELD